jgi:uncharacterized protein (TIGR02453 family)
MSDPAPFTSFSPELFQFLHELSENNVKSWWDPNKERYEREVRTPALAFIRAVGERLSEVSPHLTAIAKKSGGSMMRPFRDTRFSKDKTPYKTNVGIQFRHAAGKDIHAPGMYLHIDPDQAFLATGLWHPESSALKAIRARIDTEPEAWIAARDDAAFRSTFELQGESLKRAPRGYPKDHPLLEDLKRKDHIAVMNLTIDDVLDIGLVDDFIDAFKRASPYMRFLTEAVGQPF